MSTFQCYLPRASWDAYSSSAHLCSDESNSELEGTQGEDIEGAEYADQSLDGSQSGQSLQGFFDDQDSGSIQGPSFYRALNNEVSINQVQWALGTGAMTCMHHVGLRSLRLRFTARCLLILLQLPCAMVVPSHLKVTSVFCC